MSDAVIVSACIDGERFGDPPEETYLQVCDNMDTEVTAIAIPQVSGVGHWTPGPTGGNPKDQRFQEATAPKESPAKFCNAFGGD